MLRDYFIQGGPLMWPLLACSVFSLAVILERALFWTVLRRRRRQDLVRRVLELCAGRRFDEAADAAEGGDPAVRVLAEGLRAAATGPAEAMQVAASEELAKMRRGLGALDTIVTVAPLLGILGTVLGIIEAFHMLKGTQITEPQAVVGGLAEALITTAAGLFVAIGTVIPYNVLRSRVSGEARRIEAAATLLEAAWKAAGSPAGAAAPTAAEGRT